MHKRFAVLASVLLLGSCAGLNDWLEGKGKTDYKSAASLPPLEVPPDLTTPARDNRYAVADSTPSSATLSGYQAERREARPAGPTATSAVLPQPEHMRIERAGSQRWLVVDQPPDKLWPLVRGFWQENGFLIKLEEPDIGIMETDWAEHHEKVPEGGMRGLLSRALDTLYSTGERDKFRTRLDRSADGKGSEIYISHRGMEELYTTKDPTNSAPGATAWQPRPPDPELEAEFLRRLMLRLGAQDEKTRQVVAATASSATEPAAEQRAEIRKGLDGTEALQVFEPFDRVWRRVGLALDRVGFTVEDRDRQKGIYFVRYADPETGKDTRGLLSRWFTNESKVKAEQYRVQITQAGSASQVNVLNKDGASDNSRTAQRILALLHEQLK